MRRTNHNPKSCKEDAIALKNHSVFHSETSKLPKLPQSCQPHQTERAVRTLPLPLVLHLLLSYFVEICLCQQLFKRKHQNRKERCKSAIAARLQDFQTSR